MSSSWRASVLVVDDEKAIRDSLRMILEFEDYRVDEAADGDAALRRVAERQPDALLLDIKMPGLDGLAVLRMLRERGHDVPVLMITG
ncbi:MAG TPA: response regulator, partial [Thermoanaerobaculia bacterium]|nr:response regulator [Thermoanaerobaculia bacterium]